MRKITDPWEVSQEKPPATMDGAIEFLRNWMTQQKGKERDEDPERPLIEIVGEMMKRSPTEWWIGHHFGWGMSMRNLLRTNGYGEQELGVGNMDDYYVALIEQAVAGKGNNVHPLPEVNASDTKEK